jgi:hypothetical protein
MQGAGSPSPSTLQSFFSKSFGLSAITALATRTIAVVLLERDDLQLRAVLRQALQVLDRRARQP